MASLTLTTSGMLPYKNCGATAVAAPVTSSVKRPLTYSEVVSGGEAAAKKAKLDKAFKIAVAHEKAKRMEEAALKEKKSKLRYVVLPYPWIDDALPCAFHDRDAALEYKKGFVFPYDCMWFDGVHHEMSLALIYMYVGARANWIRWSVALGPDDVPVMGADTDRHAKVVASNPTLHVHGVIDVDADEGEPRCATKAKRCASLKQKRDKYNLNVRYTDLLGLPPEDPEHVCVLLDVESQDLWFAPHDQINMKAMAAAFKECPPFNTGAREAQDVAKFLRTVDVAKAHDGKFMYGFIDAKVLNYDKSIGDRVKDIAVYLKQVCDTPSFQKVYLSELKDHDEEMLYEILEFGGSWQKDLRDSKICVEPTYTLLDELTGDDLVRAGWYVYGLPEKWPLYIQDAAADAKKSS